jgi:hypothetical protein
LKKCFILQRWSCSFSILNFIQINSILILYWLSFLVVNLLELLIKKLTNLFLSLFTLYVLFNLILLLRWHHSWWSFYWLQFFLIFNFLDLLFLDIVLFIIIISRYLTKCILWVTSQYSLFSHIDWLFLCYFLRGLVLKLIVLILIHPLVTIWPWSRLLRVHWWINKTVVTGCITSWTCRLCSWINLLIHKGL